MQTKEEYLKRKNSVYIYISVLRMVSGSERLRLHKQNCNEEKKVIIIILQIKDA